MFFHLDHQPHSPYGVNILGRLAQSVEHLTFNQGVTGSNPVAPTTTHPEPIMTSHTCITFQDSVPQRLDRFIKLHNPFLSYGLIQKWLRIGKVRVNGKRAKPSQQIVRGDEIKLPLASALALRPPKKFSLPEEWLLQVPTWIIYEDDRLIAFNKPSGLAVQGGTGVSVSLDRLTQEALNNPELRVVHRLDRDTSGLIIFAKDRFYAQELTKAFHDHAIGKTYHALVVGRPDPSQGTIDTYLTKSDANFEKMEITPQGLRAITPYKVLKTYKKLSLSLVELTPLTGRTHQLRVHMASLDTPILGDGKYGKTLAHPFEERTPLALHASTLTFPGGLVLSVPMPQWFSEITQDGSYCS
jgi:23S rRNA pseudouridine955/2504/2580 synthase